MTAAYPQIAEDLATLQADRTRPVFQLGETVKATLGPSTIAGKVEAWHGLSGLLTIHPHGLHKHPFSVVDVWAYDGWTIEHITEQP